MAEALNLDVSFPTAFETSNSIDISEEEAKVFFF